MSEISVVIPLYNKEPYIKRAIDSVLAQTFTDFELIVVDDGSTDNSANIARGFTDDRIRIITQKNSGVSAARNRGIDEAKAELVAFLDADDEYKPLFLETIIRLRKTYPEAGAYATAYEILMPNGKTRKPKYYALPPFPWEGIIPNYFKSALGEPPIWTGAVCVKKKSFKNVGYFPEGEKLAEDLDMWARVAAKYPLSFSSRTLAVYIQDGENRLIYSSDETLGKSIIKTLKTLILTETSERKREYIKEYLAKRQLSLAHKLILTGKNRAARRILKDCQTKIQFTKKAIFLIASFLPRVMTDGLWKLKKSLCE